MLYLALTLLSILQISASLGLIVCVFVTIAGYNVMQTTLGVTAEVCLQALQVPVASSCGCIFSSFSSTQVPCTHIRCQQVILRYDCQFGLILDEAVQSLLFSSILLLQEQTSGTQAALQAEPKQAASQVSIKPGPCF